MAAGGPAESPGPGRASAPPPRRRCPFGEQPGVRVDCPRPRGHLPARAPGAERLAGRPSGDRHSRHESCISTLGHDLDPLSLGAPRPRGLRARCLDVYLCRWRSGRSPGSGGQALRPGTYSRQRRSILRGHRGVRSGVSAQPPFRRAVQSGTGLRGVGPAFAGLPHIATLPRRRRSSDSR